MGTQLQLAQNTLPIGSLDAYIHRVFEMPMLSAQEEYDLAVSYREKEDLRSAQKLVTSHLRFVVKVAKNYAGYGLAVADLIQEGNVGLMKAVKRFDPTIGVRLVSFAVHWIKAEIHEFIIKNWRIVKVATTKAQRKLFFNLRSMKKRLGWFSKDEVEDVAKILNVKPQTVLEMESRLHAIDNTFDADEDDDKAYLSPSQRLEDNSQNPEMLIEETDAYDENTKQLKEAFEKLDARSQTILQSRFLSEKKTTLIELAKTFQVSAERIRQLEQQAIEKLKTLMANAV